MLTGVLPYVGIGALVIIVALSGALWVQTERVKAKAEALEARNFAIEAWEDACNRKQANIDKLKREIAELNERVEALAAQGRAAEENQQVVDELQAELARAQADLRLIAERYREMRESAVELTVCQTYEMVLRDIAAELPP